MCFSETHDNVLRRITRGVQETSVRTKRNPRTNARLNLTELSSTLKLLRLHTRKTGPNTYPASQHRLRLFSRACLETPAVRIEAGRGK